MHESNASSRRASFPSFLFLPAIVLLLLPIFPISTFGQAGDASISGRISDPAGRIVQQAEVTIKNVATNVKNVTATNEAGIYTFPSLPPGNYVLTVHKQGFQSVDLVDLTLYTQDRLERNFTLSIGSASESVTVNGGTTNESPAVSLTVDREFIEDMPLNGESFQDLIQLAPGTVSSETGYYNIDGQRQDSNNFTVDGVSANLGDYNNHAGSDYGMSGNTPSQTLLGTTQSLASLDSLQEFTIQTSGYTAEYGRNPGGQVQFTTRSGANEVHGTLFNYFRNTVLDANSDENDNNGEPKTAEHQNDFGGTVSGPLTVPKLYNGKDRTFYFFSYEGLRLLLPSNESEVLPTSQFIQAVSTYLQPFLKARPLPNTFAAVDHCTVSGTTVVTNGSAGPNSAPCDGRFNYGFSNPSNLNSISIRLDHNISSRIRGFVRYADTPSATAEGAENPYTEAMSTHTWTGGLTASFGVNLTNEFRFNYSHDGGDFLWTQEPIEGSVPEQRSLLIPSQYDGPAATSLLIYRASGTSLSGRIEYGGGGSTQHQYQLVDGLTWVRGSHSVKVGIDWRRLTPTYLANSYGSVAELLTLPYLQSGELSLIETLANNPGKPVFNNLSLYAQDHLKLNSTLSVDYGLRWEFDPPPSPSNSQYPATLTSNDVATALVAPLGTRPYTTDYHSFAPRFGFAWNVKSSQKHTATVRGGFGIFFDTGQSVIGSAYAGAYPFTATSVSRNVSFPLSSTLLAPPSLNVSITPPYPFLQNVSNRNLTSPYTEQWTLSLDESINANNTLTVSYVGNNGRKLLFTQYYTGAPDGNTNLSGGLEFTSNAAQSSYNALQVQDVGRISRGLDVVSSFTYSHALDNASNDNSALAPEWGNSATDLRRVVNLALNYEVPASGGNGWMKSITHGWLLANRFSAQSGYPINITQTTGFLPDGAETYYYPNLVTGVPIYLHGAATSRCSMQPVPGNWCLNPKAFSLVSTNSSGTPTSQGNLGRNYVRTPSFWALNTALQRTFPIYEHLDANFRVDAFNILNHPNLGYLDPSLTDLTFGELIGGITTTIGSSNSLYAMGAARSLQLSAKIEF